MGGLVERKVAQAKLEVRGYRTMMATRAMVVTEEYPEVAGQPEQAKMVPAPLTPPPLPVPPHSAPRPPAVGCPRTGKTVPSAFPVRAVAAVPVVTTSVTAAAAGAAVAAATARPRDLGVGVRLGCW